MLNNALEYKTSNSYKYDENKGYVNEITTMIKKS